MIQLFLYRERPDRAHSRAVDVTRCRWAVHDGGRSVTFHQCWRHPAVWKDDIGLCRQHAELAGWEV